MKSLDEIKSYLSNKDGGDEIANAIVSLVESEKTKSIESQKKVKADLQTYSKYKKAIEELGYDGSEDVETFIGSVKAKTENGTKSTDELTRLKGEFGQTKAKLESFMEKYNDTRQKLTGRTLKDAVFGVLPKDDTGAYKIHAADLVVDNLVAQGRVKLRDDDETAVFVHGDSELSLQDGITKFLEERTDLIRNTQKSGGGSHPGGSSGDNNTLTRKQFDALSPVEKIERAKAGVKVVDN